MSDVLVFPDVRSAIYDLINGGEHMGHRVRAVFHLSVDSYGAPEGPFPIAQITLAPGTQGFIDRIDRVLLEVFAPGELALQVTESLHAFLVGTDIETPSAYLDSIQPDQTPHEVPYPSDTLNQAAMQLLVTTRPVD